MYYDWGLDNNVKDQSNYCLREESKKCKEETTQNKADKPLASLQRDNLNKEAKQLRYSRVETVHLLSNSVIKIAQVSHFNMSLKMLKTLKFIIFYLSTKNIQLLWKGFSKGHLFCVGCLFWAPL